MRVHPSIPGIDNSNVFNVLDVDSGRAKVSGNVVVCGGGVSGCESALALAMGNCQVTVVDMIPTDNFAPGIMDITRKMLLSLLADYKVELIGEHVVRAIDEKGVHIEGRDWQYKTLKADCIVKSFGMKSNSELSESFVELIPEVYVVGDAYEVKNIKQANLTAYNRGCNI